MHKGPFAISESRANGFVIFPYTTLDAARADAQIESMPFIFAVKDTPVGQEPELVAFVERVKLKRRR